MLALKAARLLQKRPCLCLQAESRYSLFTAPHPTDVASNIDHLDVESSSVSPSASPTFPLFTRHSCTRSMGTWGEVCVYHDVCWDGESWLVLKEDGERDHRTAGMHRGTDDQVLQRAVSLLSIRVSCLLCNSYVNLYMCDLRTHGFLFRRHPSDSRPDRLLLCRHSECI